MRGEGGDTHENSARYHELCSAVLALGGVGDIIHKMQTQNTRIKHAQNTRHKRRTPKSRSRSKNKSQAKTIKIQKKKQAKTRRLYIKNNAAKKNRKQAHLADLGPGQVEYNLNRGSHALLEFPILCELVALDLQQQVVEGVALLLKTKKARPLRNHSLFIIRRPSSIASHIIHQPSLVIRSYSPFTLEPSLVLISYSRFTVY